MLAHVRTLVASLATHIGLFLITLKSPVLSLFIVLTFFCFLFFYFSTTYLLLLVAPRISECLESFQEWSWEYYDVLMHYGSGQGSSGA